MVHLPLPANFLSMRLTSRVCVKGLTKILCELLVNGSRSLARMQEARKVMVGWAGLSPGAKLNFLRIFIDITDLELVDRLSDGKVDLTFGSSLDIFGGKTVKFDELVALSHKMTAQSTDA